MTAPATVVTPAPVADSTPVAPVVETQTPVTPAPDGVQQVQAAVAEKIGIDSVISKITKTRPTPSDDPSPIQPTEEPPPLAAEATPEAPVAEAAPETPKLVTEISVEDHDGQTVLRARDPVTGQFAEMDQTRTYELSIKDPVTGEKKVYDKTLPELMRMAKDGVAHQKSRDELAYYRKNAPQWQQQHETTTARLRDVEALAHELLTAPEEQVVARRDAYARQFTPEAENARLRQQLQEAQTRPRQQEQPSPQFVQRMADGFRQRTAPVVQEVENLVGREAAAGHMALFMQPMLHNGIIPPERLPEVEAYIHGPFREWGKKEAATRSQALQSAATSAATKEAQAKLEQARQTQAAAQLAARTVGQATRPTPITTGTAPAPQAKPTNVRELVDNIARRPQQRAG